MLTNIAYITLCYIVVILATYVYQLILSAREVNDDGKFISILPKSNKEKILFLRGFRKLFSIVFTILMIIFFIIT